MKKIHFLIINAKKTKEVIFGIPEGEEDPPIIIQGTQIERVSSYKYLGIYVDASLSWSAHIDYICSKAQQRIYFLRRLRSFGASKPIMLLFFQSIVLSVIMYGCTAWYGSLSVQRTNQIGRLICVYSKIVGQALEPIFQAAYTKKMLSLARSITSDPTHVLFEEYELLPSNRRFRLPRYGRVKMKKAFVYQSVLLLNKHGR